MTSVQEAGRTGGQSTRDKYGTEHFSRMGTKGGNATKANQDPDFYRRIGKLGGTAKRRKQSTSEMDIQD